MKQVSKIYFSECESVPTFLMEDGSVKKPRIVWGQIRWMTDKEYTEFEAKYNKPTKWWKIW